jgi:hypothetical protein
LLDFTISDEGGNRLKVWLQSVEPDLDTVRHRQLLVKELLMNQRFRERFWLAFFRSCQQRLEGRKLVTWLKRGAVSDGMRLCLILSLLIGVIGWTLFGLAMLKLIPPFWILCLIIYIGLYWSKGPQIKQAVADVQELDDELGKLKPVLEFLESHSYRSLPLTGELCCLFNTGKKRPLRQLKTIKYYTAAMGLRMNPLMALLLNLIMPWDIIFTYLIERQKSVLQERLPKWMDTIYELEALIALTNFAYVNPHYTFPKLHSCEEKSGCFSVKDLGHPLISEEKKVRNDFTFAKLGEVVLITGSNMTGKSTFLKTLGINLKLAYAGGPVDAGKMITALFRVMTSIRIQDSLSEDVSYFYAEVKRLKQILTALEEQNTLPVFFLIDEIFKGTNNRERYLGSMPYIKAVSGKNGVGLISTHDVTLCKLEENVSLISNRHFGDAVDGGKFSFDYKLLPGPSISTNALKILESEGLPVEKETEIKNI